jgi:hypothetical protein
MRSIEGAEPSSVPAGSAAPVAVHQHVWDMPAPIIVVTLSQHPVTAARIATQVGVALSRDTPDDHTRTGDS